MTGGFVRTLVLACLGCLACSLQPLLAGTLVADPDTQADRRGVHHPGELATADDADGEGPRAAHRGSVAGFRTRGTTPLDPPPARATTRGSAP